MAAEDCMIDSFRVQSYLPERHFVNINPNPEHFTVRNSNARLQELNPEWYCKPLSGKG